MVSPEFIPHPCLTKDWILGQFGSKRRQSEKKYREFVMAGLGEEKIWKDVKGQSILGQDEFIERFLKHSSMVSKPSGFPPNKLRE